jgi:hypothetical protein
MLHQYYSMVEFNVAQLRHSPREIWFVASLFEDIQDVFFGLIQARKQAKVFWHISGDVVKLADVECCWCTPGKFRSPVICRHDAVQQSCASSHRQLQHCCVHKKESIDYNRRRDVSDCDNVELCGRRQRLAPRASCAGIYAWNPSSLCQGGQCGD